MFSRIHYMILVILFEDSTSSKIIYEYEYPNGTASRRHSEFYDYHFKNGAGQHGTDNFRGKHHILPDKEEYDYFYLPDKSASERFWNEEKEGREAEEYYDRLPQGNLNEKATVTIEQFVAELKKRIQEKDIQKQKDNKLNVKLTGNGRNKRKQETNTVRTQKGKGILKKGTIPPLSTKVLGPKKQKTLNPNTNRSIRPKDRGNRRPKTMRTPNLKTNTKVGTRRPNKITPPKTSNKIIERPQIIQIPSKKIIVKPSAVQNPSIKPTRKQKTFHKPKKDIGHKVNDEEDFFQIGNSNPHQHGDHHIHQHDHLEAHKHHQKHKASHSHDHAHANDHVHNHKHTHNHVHNHIHKHNEAHEHTAEHAHTEKHNHKHLEYIDAGGWRRRSDPNSEPIIIDEPVALAALPRESTGRNLDVEDLVKKELEKYINVMPTERSYDNLEFQNIDSHSYDDYEPFEEFQDVVEKPQILYNDAISSDGFTNRGKSNKFGNFENEFSEKSLNVNEPSQMQNDYFVTPFPSSMELTKEKNKLLDLIPDDQKNKYPVEVEEITYEEYMELQKKGETFEEPLDDYEASNGYESLEFNGYSDQQGFGTNNNYVRVKYDGPEKDTNNKYSTEKIRIGPRNDVKNIRIISPQNEVSKLMMVNPKNEISFDTYNGFQTMPMMFKNNDNEIHDIKFEDPKVFKSGKLLDNPTGIWKIVEDKNVEDIKEPYAINRMGKLKESENETPPLSKSGRSLDSPSQIWNILENKERGNSENELVAQNRMDKLDDIDYEDQELVKFGRSFDPPAKFFNEIESGEEKDIKEELIAQNRMDYGNIDYYFFDEVRNNTNHPSEFVAPLPNARYQGDTNRKLDEFDDNLQQLNQEEIDYNEYYDELLAKYSYEDFEKLNEDNLKDDIEDGNKKMNQTIVTDVPSHTKYDFDEPRPVYIVYPATEVIKEEKEVATEDNSITTTTAATDTKAVNVTSTEYSIDYNNFL